MPTYTFECPECGRRMEKSQSITDDSVPSCEECDQVLEGPVKMKRIIVPGGSFILKGRGWAKDGYK